jgi:formate/nitrite transporter FocA (FNT family)
MHTVAFVILGNIVGGSLMVALAYYATYLRPSRRATEPAPPAA